MSNKSWKPIKSIPKVVAKYPFDFIDFHDFTDIAIILYTKPKNETMKFMKPINHQIQNNNEHDNYFGN